MNSLSNILRNYKSNFEPILGELLSQNKFCIMDFTENNFELQNVNLADTNDFVKYVNETILSKNCDFGIGGYAEDRNIYWKSEHFNNEDEPRTIHLGVDIWAPSETPIFTPINGIVHSYAFNNNYGDYGPTIILEHILDARKFYTLYGHLSLQSIDKLVVGKEFKAGSPLGFIGNFPVNGDWPPHLHFQIIDYVGDYWGDYPGVCKLSEIDYYLENCPDPDLILV